MKPIIEYPQVVTEAMDWLAPVFRNDCQRRHCAEYLTGLLLADRKSVTSINRDFLHTTDPSCLNRYLTEAPWDVEHLNTARLEMHQQDPTTKYHDRGVIPIDNVLLEHSGEQIADVAWFWDHAEQRHKIAHDYIFANYVSIFGKHYPLHFRRFQTKTCCADLQIPFRNHTQLVIELIDWVDQQAIPGTFTFDCYFTSAEILNHIHGKELRPGQPRAYVGDLKFNRKVHYRGRALTAGQLAESIPPADRKVVSRPSGKQWYFTCTLRIPKVNHPVRILILWADAKDLEAKKILITNQTFWEVHRILEVYGARWTGTETFHRDGKQHLGMGDCQLRQSQGQTRHMHLVMLAYSILVRQLDSHQSHEWAFGRLTTIGQACRAALQEITRKTIQWVIHQVQVEQWSGHQIITYLRLNSLAV